MAELNKEQRKALQKHSRRHEWAATFGVSNTVATAIVIFRWPQFFWLWHLVKFSILIPWRFVRFLKVKRTLYLLDWCYIVSHLINSMTLIALVRVTFGYVSPLAAYNTQLVRAGFAMATGPLAWSIFIFRNSLVFHNVDNITSVFIHFSPMALFYCLRWGSGMGPSVIDQAWPSVFKVCPYAIGRKVVPCSGLAAADACVSFSRSALWCDACAASPSEFLVGPAIIYVCVWAVPYFLICFVLLREWARRNKQEMLYDYFCAVQPALVEKLRRVFGPAFGPELGPRFGYLVLHCVSVLIFGVASYVFWHSFVLHTAFCLGITFVAVHNGSTYTFRYFAHRCAWRGWRGGVALTLTGPRPHPLGPEPCSPSPPPSPVRYVGDMLKRHPEVLRAKAD